jgi:hypothetical protein
MAPGTNGATVWWPILAMVLRASGACGTSDVVGVEQALRLRVMAGDGQRAGAGAAARSPVTVRAERVADGAPVAGVRIRFSVAAPNRGGASIEDSVVVTNEIGVAATRVVTGAPDTVRVEAALAAAPGMRALVTVIVTAGPTLTSVLPADARPGDTLRLAGSGFSGTNAVVRLGAARLMTLPGRTDVAVRAVVPACALSGATDVMLEVDGAPSNAIPLTVREARVIALLAPYEHISVPAGQLANCVSLPGDGTYLVAAQFASAPAGAFAPAEWLLGADAAPGATLPTTAAAPLARGAPAEQGPREAGTRSRARSATGGAIGQAFDLRRRSLERTLAAGTAASGPARALAAEATAPTPGTLREFNVVAALDGSRFARVTGRLHLAGDRVLTYVDTAARFTAAQLTAFARLLDRDLHPAAVSAFGAAPDVDGNGRVIVLLTPVVNAMVRAQDCIFSGYVTGFFYPIDEFVRAEHSNRAEVFYGFVPDSAGRYSCAHTEAEVIRTLQATYLHEAQHLISFNAKVLAQGGDPEDTWLNEGLGQLAEELGSRLFEARYPAPLGRSTLEQLFPDSAAPFIAPQMLNAYVYLTRPLEHSVTAYERAGSLEERGATWLFLRWLADQHGEDVPRRLVQSTRRGAASVEAAAGESLASLFGDFALAVFTDSLPGLPRAAVPSRLRFHTRNVRRLMAREAVISGFPSEFPLTTYLLSRGTALRGTMLPGTMMHAIIPGTPGVGPVRLTFTAPSGAPLAPDFGAQVSVLRLPP